MFSLGIAQLVGYDHSERIYSPSNFGIIKKLTKLNVSL